MSPVIQPDTSEAEDLTPIEPGTYKARIVSGASQLSAEKKQPMFVPTFKITVDGKERTRKAYIPVTGAGAFGFDQILRAVGEVELAEKFKANPGQVPFDTDMLNNRELNVVIGTQIYNGQPRDLIQSYLPV